VGIACSARASAADHSPMPAMYSIATSSVHSRSTGEPISPASRSLSRT
jgi:hypothetical protein